MSEKSAPGAHKVMDMVTPSKTGTKQSILNSYIPILHTI
jgi:hypothetical protein